MKTKNLFVISPHHYCHSTATIIEGLNKSGHHDIIVIDHLKNGMKFRNISDLDISDYYDKKYY